ncbi:MAG: lipoate--protein ligase [Pseudodesulfovibrio sp.]|uniref:lipoate--protein ligase n=1 Tax=Pseudodesulfovibrio indicus TaxID=1716143 RepID=A0A126QRA1_9BACT|nr:lipoate--protein ligase [Pseudodesulfovibrio indicus]AMK12521.1 lipoate--protein ligase [Pseudodesulfovibrio indicus]TDT90831.1 lipoate-protein ligase A [Pseudodesulfovibrio indicus]
MRYIHNPVTDPAFNLAAEEWLLTRSDEDVFMLWRNRPAVIVGRNQNTLAEIDEAFTRTRGIPVVRRLSGGGAVFHDLGNINFTFITRGNPSQGLDFERFTAPIQQALGAMGVACEFSGRNDLLIDGKKFSGNAQHFHAGRILHHGTLLFASDMADLSGALRTDPEKYRDKAVKSVRSRVTNISSHLPAPMEVTAFIKALMDHVSGHTPMDDMVLSAEEQASIEALAAARYRTWEWNFGSSPAYNFSRRTRTPGGLLDVNMQVKKGLIVKARLFGDYFGVRDIDPLERRIEGCAHERTALEERLSGLPLGEYLNGVTLPVLLDCLF